MALSAAIAEVPPIIVPETLNFPASLMTWSLMSEPLSTGFEVTRLVVLSRKLQMEYKEINKQFWSKHLWVRGYFISSSGNVIDEVIADYIRLQDIAEKQKSDNFTVSEL